MLKRKQTIVAAAALAAAPLAARAAVITYGYDTTVTYGTNAGITAGTVTAAIVNNQVTIPAGDFFKFNINVDVTNNANPVAAGAYATNNVTQPANLGLAAFGFTIADSAPTAVVPRVVGGNAVVKNLAPNNSTTLAYDSSGTGASSTTTGAVGTSSAPLSGGLLPGNSSASKPSQFYRLTLGANTTQDIVTGLTYQALSSSKSVLTATNTATAYAVISTNGTSTSPPTYSLANTTVNDTINNLPALTINPATGGTTHNIVNLTSATQTGGNYGVQLASGSGNNQATFNPGTNAPLITVVSHGSGAYTPGAANSIDGGTGDATDFTGVTGFLAGDQEVYALKLKVGGATPTTTQINQIVTDISGQTGDGVSTVASLLSPSGNLATSVAAIFPGYDLMLTVASGSTTPFLGFDFSQETNVAGVTVTDIGAIPEPASAAMLLIGSSGLLMGRRKRALLKA